MDFVRKTSRCLWEPVLTLLLVLTSSVLWALEAEQLHYYSHGDSVTVHIVDDLIGIRFSYLPNSEQVREVREAVDLDIARNVEVPIAEAFQKDGMVIYSTATDDAPSSQFLQSLSRRLLARNSTARPEDNPTLQVGNIVTLGNIPTPVVMTDRIMVSLKRPDQLPNLALVQVEGRSVGELTTQVYQFSARPLVVLLQLNQPDPALLLKAASAIFESGLVEFATPEFFYARSNRTIPWHLEHDTKADINAEEAWIATTGSPEVTVAVIEQGFEVNHSALSANVIGTGKNFTRLPMVTDGAESPIAASNEHGTQTAGVIAANGAPENAAVGVCPNCRLLLMRTSISANTQTYAAIQYAIEQKARVINNSWGDTLANAEDHAIDSIVAQAVASGIAVVWAVNNIDPMTGSKDDCASPKDISALPDVITVSGSSHLDVAGSIGNHGKCLNLVAPTENANTPTGNGIHTTNINNGYTVSFGGTSAAAGIVSGVAGLVFSVNESLNGKEVQAILENSAEKIEVTAGTYNDQGFNKMAGYGRVDAARAVVPTVEIKIKPDSVAVDEPFDIVVTATAPFGLTGIWWFGAPGFGLPDELTRAFWHNVDGQVSASFTWEDITISRSGSFEFGANARDQRYPNPNDGHPHQASEGSGLAYATIVVE